MQIYRHVLCFRLLLSEDPEDEVGFSVGLEGGGDDEVLPGGQANAGAHLSQVDEGLRASARLVAQKEIFLQMDILTASVLRAAGGNTRVKVTLYIIAILQHCNMLKMFQ